MTTTIRHADFVESIAAALQYISYYHPADYIAHLAQAYEREQSPAAKDAIAQILTNSKMCAEGHRPICQDTGIVNVFLKIGMDVRFDGFAGSIEDAVNDGVRKGYLNPDNVLRASVLDDPIFARRNTKDNTPAVVQMELVPGSTIDVIVAAKGGGSENKSKVYMLNPSDDIVDWVLKTVPTMGAGWCPPGMLGIGVGGTAEKAALLAKQALMDDIDMYQLLARGPQNKLEELRIELYEKVNALGIGAQGLGGLTTVLDVKIKTFPDARRQQADRDDPELRRHAPRALRARRLGPGLPGAAQPGPVARREVGARLQQEPQGRPGHADTRARWPAGSRATRCCCRASC
jgi:fumarate hydratase class I